MELSRLKIPLFFAYDVLHGQRTVFPISLGLASSFNLDAVKTVGRVSAYEAADDGLNMTWAPMVDVSRDPRWGRASEGFGEDTYLTSIMGKTMVEAIQGESPADRYSVTEQPSLAGLTAHAKTNIINYAAVVQKVFAAVFCS